MPNKQTAQQIDDEIDIGGFDDFDLSPEVPSFDDADVSAPGKAYSSDQSGAKDHPGNLSDRAGNQHINTKPAPVPPLVKFGLPLAIIVVVGVAGFGALYFSTSNDSSEAALSPASQFEIGSAPITGDQRASIPENSPSKVNSSIAPYLTNEALNNLVDEVYKLHSTVASLEQSNAGLLVRVKGDEQLLSDHSSMVGNLRSNLSGIVDKSIAPLNQSINKQASSINHLRTAVKKNNHRIDGIIKQKDGAPPFILVSIDEWDTTTSAVLQMAGKTTIAAVGDVRAGWRVTEILRPNCISVVSISNGNKVMKVCGRGVL